MRKNQVQSSNSDYKIIALDDDAGVIDTLSVFLKRSGYDLTRSYRSIRSY